MNTAKLRSKRLRKADGTKVEVSLDKHLKVLGSDTDTRDDSREDDRDDVDASDDPGVAYEVDVRKADGTSWDVDLDSSFGVVRKAIDR